MKKCRQKQNTDFVLHNFYSKLSSLKKKFSDFSNYGTLSKYPTDKKNL